MARALIAASNEVVVAKTFSKPKEFWQGICSASVMKIGGQLCPTKMVVLED